VKSGIGEATSRPTIVLAGVSNELESALRTSLPAASIRSAGSSGEVIAALGSDGALVLVVNHTLTGPSASEMVRQARQLVPEIPIVYLLDKRLDSEMGRTILQAMGVHSILLHPVAPEQLAGEIAQVLPKDDGVPDMAADREDAGAGQPAPRDEWSNGRAAQVTAAEPEPGLPQVPADQGIASAASAAAIGHAGYLLIVDESSDLASRIAVQAEPQGLRVEIQTSLTQARQLLQSERPDVALIDLPFSNGSDEGLALLEELDRRDSPTAVIFMAERDTFFDRMQAANLGGRGFIPKSFPPAEIVRSVTRLLTESRSSESRILVIDDDPETLADLTALLEPRGIALTTLTDPLRFWAVLEYAVPDLLLLDFDLPRWSGVELCKVVRSDTRWSTLPVVFLTAGSDSDTVQRVFDAGADDYVTKPIVGSELVTKVANRLRRVQLYRNRAEVDPLTGVANRLKGTESLDRLLRLAGRQRQEMSLAILDLDDFKQINDRFGHGAGDDALRRLGSLLIRTFRSEDVVARWGGEEFVVGMYGMPRPAGVQRLEEVLRALHDETPPKMRGDNTLLSFSAGVAQYPDDGSDLEALYEAADRAQYAAKAAGKNRVLPAGATPGDSATPSREPADVVLVAAESVGGPVLQMLEAAGYRCQWLKDGERASLALGGADAASHPQVMVLDLDAASLDGLSVLRRLMRDGTMPRTRVIVLGDSSRGRDLQRALDLGAFGSIARPFRPSMLVQRVREAMEVL